MSNEIDRLGDPDVVKPRKRDRIKNAAARARDGALRVATDPRIVSAVQRSIGAVDDALSNPENIEKVQSVMARVGSFAMERGFRSSPHARVLFEYAQWCEDTRSRKEVSESVFRDGLKLPFDVLNWVQETVRSGKVNPADFERIQNLTLDLLWNMATDAARPQTVTGLERGLEREGIPAPFQELFWLTLGLGTRTPETGGTTSGMLARWAPDLQHPAVRFMTTAIPVFLQSYLLTLAVEALPGILSDI